MPNKFLAALGALTIIFLIASRALLSFSTSTSPNTVSSLGQTKKEELSVISQTRGDEAFTAQALDNQLRIRLKNNHKDTITAFAISFSDTIIKEDFAYSDVSFGIEPGDTFEKDYSVSPSPGSDLRTLYLLVIVLKNGSHDGDAKVWQSIRDERLGEKVQILRTLRILEKEGQSSRDLKTIKSDIVDSLHAGESETRITLNELQPTARIDNGLSDDFKAGLQWGREKMVRRLQVVEHLPTESQEAAILELKDRSRKLLSKL